LMASFVQFGCLASYRDKKVVGVFVRFRAPLHRPMVSADTEHF
jgi:hypothetical protein